MLAVNNIEVAYAKVILVLRGVTLEVGEGQIVSLLGANGAGKSTTLKSISGLLAIELGEITHGTIEFQGSSLVKKSAQEIATLGIRQVIEGRRLYEHLNVEENLKLGGYLNTDRKDVAKRLEQVYNYFPIIK